MRGEHKDGPADDAPELENTGERFLPGTMASAEIAYDHVARYRLAERYVTGRRTIDLGSGAGYGSHLLSSVADEVLGVDFSQEAVDYANWSYAGPGLTYQVADVTDLPYGNGEFQAAVSFEVIEHLERPEAIAEEARRVLGEDGVFVVSTPDKRTYSLDRNSVNPHHLRELFPREFKEMLERHFRHVQIYRQGALAGSVITPDTSALPADGGVTLESTRFSLPDPVFARDFPATLYVIAVCTDGDPPPPLDKPHLILDCDRQVYEEHFDMQINLSHVLLYHEVIVQQRAQAQILAFQGLRSWKVAQKLAGWNQRWQRARDRVRSRLRSGS